MKESTRKFWIVVGLGTLVMASTVLGFMVGSGRIDGRGLIAGLALGGWSNFGYLGAVQVAKAMGKKSMGLYALGMLAAGLGVWLFVVTPYLELQPKPDFFPIGAGMILCAIAGLTYATARLRTN